MSQKIEKIIKLIVIGSIAMIMLLTCEEQIPEGPPKVQVIEADLYVPFDRKVFPQPTNYENRYKRPADLKQEDWDFLTDSDIRFRIKINNIFDETIDGLKWIDVTLKLWSTNFPDIKRTLTYQNLREDSILIVLHPGKSYYVYTEDSLIWEQRDEVGTLIHKTDRYHTFGVRLDSLFSKEKNKWEFFCDTTYYAWVDTVKQFDIPIRMKAQAWVRIFKNYEPIETNIFGFQISYIYPPGMTDVHECPIGGGGK